jgi:predicted porin
MKALKKLLAASLALALPLAAAAQAAAEPKPAEPAKPAAAAAPKLAWTVYGMLNVNLQYTQSEDATAGTDVDGRFAVSTDSTNIGFRGSYEFTPVIGATFQCETAANIDGIGPVGICGRNSRVGLTGTWGTLFYGNWDTPYKAASYGTKADDPFFNTDVYAYQGIMGSPGFNYRSSGWKTAATDAIQGFDIRSSNSVGYHSPKFGGLSFKAQWSANEFATDDTNLTNPQLWAAVVNYDMGPVSVFASGELHQDAFGLNRLTAGPTAGTPPAATPSGVFGSTAVNPTNVDSQDWAARVGAGYELATGAGTTTVGAMFEWLSLGQDDAPTGSIEEYTRWAAQVSLKHRVGNHEFRGRFSLADDGDCDLRGGGACNTDDFGAIQYAVGYGYHFSKAVQGYVHATQIMNDDNAQYTFSIGGAPNITGATGVTGTTDAGADPLAVGVGIRYVF